MKGLTVAEMAKRLEISPNAVKSRLHRAGIEAHAYAGMCGLYQEKDYKAISAPRPAGRPRKTPKTAP